MQMINKCLICEILSFLRRKHLSKILAISEAVILQVRCQQSKGANVMILS